MHHYEQGYFSFMKVAGLVRDTFRDTDRFDNAASGLMTDGLEGALRGFKGEETDYDMLMSGAGLLGGGIGVGLGLDDLAHEGKLQRTLQDNIGDVSNVIPLPGVDMPKAPKPGVLDDVRRGASMAWRGLGPVGKAVTVAGGLGVGGLGALNAAAFGKGIHERMS